MPIGPFSQIRSHLSGLNKSFLVVRPKMWLPKISVRYKNIMQSRDRLFYFKYRSGYKTIFSPPHKKLPKTHNLSPPQHPVSEVTSESHTKVAQPLTPHPQLPSLRCDFRSAHQSRTASHLPNPHTHRSPYQSRIPFHPSPSRSALSKDYDYKPT